MPVDGLTAHPSPATVGRRAGPGRGRPLQPDTTCGRYGLHFAANYHVSPATVLEAAEGYRAAFQPSDHLDKPYVSVSADV